MGKRGPKPSTNSGLKDRLGAVSILKGSTRDGIPVVQWDAIQDCDGRRCNLGATCPLMDEGKKCGIRREYLDYVYRHLIGFVKPTAKMSLFKIGFHLIPLFSQLVSLKIANHGRPVTYLTDKGSIQMNPLFREIRETIRAINQNIADIADDMDKGFQGGGEGDDLLGDSGYYDQLFQDGSIKVERKMRNRV